MMSVKNQSHRFSVAPMMEGADSSVFSYIYEGWVTLGSHCYLANAVGNTRQHGAISGLRPLYRASLRIVSAFRFARMVCGPRRRLEALCLTQLICWLSSVLR